MSIGSFSIGFLVGVAVIAGLRGFISSPEIPQCELDEMTRQAHRIAHRLNRIIESLKPLGSDPK